MGDETLENGTPETQAVKKWMFGGWDLLLSHFNDKFRRVFHKRPFPGMFFCFCIFVLIEGKPATILNYIYSYI